MEMHNPPHPGEVIRECCLKPLDLTVTAAAAGLGVTRKALSELLNGHSGISADMAVRLERAGWSQADMWLRMQVGYDLWHAKRRPENLRVKPFAAPRGGATMQQDDFTIEEGSGNVFADIGLPNADERLAQAELISRDRRTPRPIKIQLMHELLAEMRTVARGEISAPADAAEPSAESAAVLQGLNQGKD